MESKIVASKYNLLYFVNLYDIDFWSLNGNAKICVDLS